MSGGSGSGDGCIPFAIIAFGILVIGGIIVGAIVATVHKRSLLNAERTTVTLRQEGIVSHIWTKVRLNPCTNCSFNASYHRWLHVRLHNKSTDTHTVIVCGPEISTATVKYNGPDCYWFTLKPGAKVNKMISGTLSLQEVQGFKTVNRGGVEAIDNHPVPDAPERMCYTTSYNEGGTPVVCNRDGNGNPPSPGMKA